MSLNKPKMYTKGKKFIKPMENHSNIEYSNNFIKSERDRTSIEERSKLRNDNKISDRKVKN